MRNCVSECEYVLKDSVTCAPPQPLLLDTVSQTLPRHHHSNLIFISTLQLPTILASHIIMCISRVLTVTSSQSTCVFERTACASLRASLDCTSPRNHPSTSPTPSPAANTPPAPAAGPLGTVPSPAAAAAAAAAEAAAAAAASRDVWACWR
jgi:hypothetical protein